MMTRSEDAKFDSWFLSLLLAGYSREEAEKAIEEVKADAAFEASLADPVKVPSPAG